MSTITKQDATRQDSEIPLPRSRIRRVIPTQVPSDSQPAEVSPERNEKAGDNWRDDGTYIIGKNRPPVSTRWQKGQSGNPRGKKQGTRNFDTQVIELMEGSIAVKTASGEKRMERKAALLHRTYEIAVKGDLRAARLLFDEYSRAKGREVSEQAESKAISADEQTMLRDFMTAMGFAQPAESEDSK